MGASSGPGSVGTRSGTHTRSSSFCEDMTDSYIPMAPQSLASSSVTSRDADDSCYMDMQVQRSIARDVHGVTGRGRLSPASCSSLASSLTSGTTSVPFGTPPTLPSASGRFHEYHLEKVASLLTPSEDDDELSSLRCRQSRAYSVGSRPDIRRKMTSKMDPMAPSSIVNSDARVRAYSVGSRVTHPPVSGSSQQLSTSNDSSVSSSRNNVDSVADAPQASTEEKQRKKSLSVPVLGGSSSPVSNSWTNPTGTFLRKLMDQSSGRRDNDLMEIEFSQQSPVKDSYISCDSIGTSLPRRIPIDHMGPSYLELCFIFHLTLYLT